MVQFAEQHYRNKSRCIEAAGYVEKAKSSCRCDHRSMAKHISGCENFFFMIKKLSSFTLPNYDVDGFPFWNKL